MHLARFWPPLLLLLFHSACMPAAVQSPPAQPSTPDGVAAFPPDFAVRFQTMTCIARELDSFVGTLTRYEPKQPPLQVPLQLTPGEMGDLYQELLRTGFFSLPERIEPATSDPQTEVTPFSGFRLEVRADGRTRVVHWTDKYTATPEVRRMVPLVRLLWNVLQRTETEQQVPRPDIMCL